MHEYMTVSEIASALRVSRMTVYRLCHSGELEYVRIGRSMRVPKRAFEVYVASR